MSSHCYTAIKLTFTVLNVYLEVGYCVCCERKADGLVASLPNSTAFSRCLQYTNFCCRERTLRTRPWMGVCEPLMPDVVASKAQLQLCKLSGPTFGFTTQEFSMVGGYTENLEKPQNCQNWGVDACSGQYGSCNKISTFVLLLVC